MKVVFTGGGSGGHFYPLIAIAQALNKVVDEEKIVDVRLYYFSDAPYDERALFDNGMEFRRIPAGKLRIYPSIRNVFDVGKTLWGMVEAVLALFSVYPDIVVGKGGYASFPTLFAARLLNIPVLIHESDSVPGRTNAWAGKFAKRIAVSFGEAAARFPEGKTALTGQPVRTSIAEPLREGAAEYLHLDPRIPTILVLGGSQGAERINNAILEALPELLEFSQVIHQTGASNFTDVTRRAGVILEGNAGKSRYVPFDYLNDLSLRMSAGIATVVISRAGSALFEIASWGLPAIVITIEESNGDHQRENAFNYARSGAAIVIEENNLTPKLLVREVSRLVADESGRAAMSRAARSFFRKDAGTVIAREIVEIALTHAK